MMRFLFVVLLLLPAVVQSQPDTLWTRSYGADQDLWGVGVQPAAGGGFLMVGSPDSMFNDGRTQRWCVVRTSSTGDSLWSRWYTWPEPVFCCGLCSTRDGGYILAGSFYDDTFNATHAVLLKINSNGDSLWSRQTPEAYYSERIIATADSGCLLVGWTCDFLGAFAIKMNADGNRVYTFTDYDPSTQFYDAGLGPNGRVFLAGHTGNTPSGSWDYKLVSLNSAGELEWAHTYGTAEYDEMWSSVAVTSEGSCYISGVNMGNTSDPPTMWLVKTDTDGDSLWSRTFGAAYWWDCPALVALPDGGCVVGCREYPSGSDQLDYGLVHVSPNSDTLWTARYDHPGDDWCNDMLLTEDGGYLVFGGSLANTASFYAVKTGRDPMLSAAIHLSPYPSSLSLSNFPNPFNPSTWITFDLPRAGNVSLKVFDLLGREVMTLKDGSAPSGTHRLLFDGKGLASGTYVIHLEANGATQSRKITLLK